MNKVILMGRLTRDPEYRVSQNAEQTAIARYTLAVDRRVRRAEGQQTTDFIRCVAFNKSADFAYKYMHQGMRMLISGRIQTGSYQDKDGKTVYTTDVVVDDQEFADSKGVASQMPQAAPGADGFMSIPDGVDDCGLPFN